jgi:hypothetical protein
MEPEGIRSLKRVLHIKPEVPGHSPTGEACCVAGTSFGIFDEVLLRQSPLEESRTAGRSSIDVPIFQVDTIHN